MAYLSVADLIAGPVRLSPAEAAALTLAIARKLDNEAAQGREPRLPDDHGILLSSTGTVAFVRGADAAASDAPVALAALLMRLLRLDGEGPRAHVPGGLLIVLARNLGYIQLPPTSPDAFRAALERFATSDPTLLAGIFWRAARLKGGVSRRGPDASGAAEARVERRRGGPTRAELRRALRAVERELFVTQRRLARTSRAARERGILQAVISKGSMLRWAGAAAGVVLIASIAAGSGSRRSQPEAASPILTQADSPRLVRVSRTSAGPAPRRSDAVIALPASESAARPAPASRLGKSAKSTARSAERSGAMSAPRSTTTSASASAVHQRTPRRAGRERPDAPARRFAGGARQIVWTLQGTSR